MAMQSLRSAHKNQRAKNRNKARREQNIIKERERVMAKLNGVHTGGVDNYNRLSAEDQRFLVKHGQK